jgi:hypothetical protein
MRDIMRDILASARYHARHSHGQVPVDMSGSAHRARFVVTDEGGEVLVEIPAARVHEIVLGCHKVMLRRASASFAGHSGDKSWAHPFGFSFAQLLGCVPWLRWVIRHCAGFDQACIHKAIKQVLACIHWVLRHCIGLYS